MLSNQANQVQALLSAMPELILTSIACIFIGAGLFVLFTNWQKSHSSTWVKLAGWLLISSATPFWITAYGVEFGISFELIIIALLAWTFIAIHRDIKPIKLLPENKGTINTKRSSNNKKMISAQVFTVTFIAPIFSLCVSQVSGSLLPVSLASQMVIQALGFPIIWSLLAIWLCFTEKFWRLSVALLVVSLAYLWQTFG